MINLIYGLPGTGKTTEITKQIRQDIEAGRQVLLIVPEQQTVETERNMLMGLPASAQLSFEVLNFTRLANKIFRIYGGLSYNYITKGMKNLLMKRTLLELAPILSEYQLRALGDSSLPSLMLSQINEFKTNGISVKKLEDVLEDMEEEGQFKTKLTDLAAIYSHFSDTVEKSYSDGSDDLAKLYDKLCDHDFFKKYNVYIDSFSSFTAWEYKIIGRIFAQAENCTVTIPSPDELTNDIHLTSVNDTSKKLLNLARGKTLRKVKLSNPYRATTPALKRLWAHFWDFSANFSKLPSTENDTSVEIIECADMYSESEAAANAVLSLLHAGYRRNEIAVVAGDMDTYKGTIDSVFEKAGIPFYMSEKTDLVTNPLISLMMSAFAIKQRNWRADDVIAYLKTGLTGIPTEKIDLFEIYVSTWKIKGLRFFDESWTMNPDGYSNKISNRGIKIREVANEVKNILTSTLPAFFTRLDAAENVRELCAATYNFFKELGLTEKLCERAKKAHLSGNKRIALEYAGTHSAFISVLNDISATLGDEKMTVEEFCSSLKLVLGNTDIGTIPTAADEVVLGSASMLRASGIKCAILIGMCDGKFPAHVSDGGFFSDIEKEKLSSYGIELSSKISEKSSDELLHTYRAVTLPSDKLIMSYHTKVGSTVFRPSLAITRACSLLGIKKPLCYEKINELDKLMSEKLSLESYHSLTDDKNRAALASVLGKKEDCADILKKTKAPISTTECKISNDLSNSLFGQKIRLSQSKIDQYVKCHFNYFCKFVLNLRDTTPISFNAADTGTFVHHLLELFIGYTVDENGLKRDIPKDELERFIRDKAKEYIDSIFKDKVEPSKRQLHLFGRLTGLAVVVASSLYDELLDSSFIPKYLEMKFGNAPSDALPQFELKLKDDTKIIIDGAVDRLDVFKKDNTVYVKVIDYKTGSKTFDLADVEKGLNIQLLLYLFAICNAKDDKFKRSIGCENGDTIKPAGVIYVSSAFSAFDVKYNATEEEIIAMAKKKLPRSGLVTDDDEIIKEMSHNLKNRYLPGVTTNKDGVITKNSSMSKEGFDELEKQIYSTIEEIATELKSGNADIAPMKIGRDYVCQYCKMKPFCRVDLTSEGTDEEENEDDN